VRSLQEKIINGTKFDEYTKTLRYWVIKRHYLVIKKKYLIESAVLTVPIQEKILFFGSSEASFDLTTNNVKRK